ILTHPGVVFLDTETTGIGQSDEVIEIAILDATGRMLLQAISKPSCSVDPGAASVHGLDDTLLASAPAWPVVYRDVLAVLRTVDHVVTYNADFDRRLIAQTCARYDLRFPSLQWHCAMRRFADYAGRPLVESWRAYHRLSEALERLGIPHPGSHRAANDAEACRRLVHAMARGLPRRY
ncbi:MAG: 3'-5' exonuclease, partial [Thermomicrobium sp.]|nr:3'-5' exonuclease [Thermomicrobium sp.]